MEILGFHLPFTAKKPEASGKPTPPTNSEARSDGSFRGQDGLWRDSYGALLPHKGSSSVLMAQKRNEGTVAMKHRELAGGGLEDSSGRPTGLAGSMSVLHSTDKPL